MAEQNKGSTQKDEQSPDDGNPDDGNPEYENFQQLLKQVLSVSKAKLDEKRAEYEREKKDRKWAG